MYFSVQNYPAANPLPYDDTGWTMQYMRNIERSRTAGQVGPRSADDADHAKCGPGRIDGSGGHSGDRSHHRQLADVVSVSKTRSEDARGRRRFQLGGTSFRAGAFIIPNADSWTLRASIQESGLSAWAVAAVPAVKTHEMEIPRIGYVHSWQNAG